MPYEEEEDRTVRSAWTVEIRGVPITIPAGEVITVAHNDDTGGVRVFWREFARRQLGFSAQVTEEDLALHT
jgi:hypothetical protein